MSTPIVTGSVPVPDGKLYFERAGQGPAIVLIHSAFLDHREWDPQFASYADRHTVVRYDVRGVGRSPGDRSNASDAEDLEALLNHLELTHAFILGNSDGARIACEFAAGMPDRVPGLILVAGGPHDLEPTEEEKARFMNTFENGPEKQLVELVQTGRRPEIIELSLDIWAPRVSPEQRARLRGILNDNYEHFLEFLRQDGAGGRRPSYPVADSLRRDKVPLLSISGAHDNPALNLWMGRFAATVPGGHHVEIAEGDHTPSLSATAEFDRSVLDFLARIDSGQSWPPSNA